jgi:CheY-like chemotaxis protein
MILIVDDDTDTRETLTDVLGDEGYSVVGAADGLEALELLRSVTPRLILLDLNMPSMDGQSFRERQLRTPPLASIPTVALSAVSQLPERVGHLTFDEVLTKPVDLDALLALVERYCGKVSR